MIPLPAKLKLVLGVLLIGGVAALQALSKLEPTWSWAGGVVQLLVGLELYFTAPGASKTPAKVPPLAMFCLLLTGCALFGAVAPPAIATVGCIVDDAAAGKSIAQIVADCGGDVVQVIGVLTSPTAPPAVMGTKAQIEAKRALAVPVGK